MFRYKCSESAKLSTDFQKMRRDHSTSLVGSDGGDGFGDGFGAWNLGGVKLKRGFFGSAGFAGGVGDGFGVGAGAVVGRSHLDNRCLDRCRHVYENWLCVKKEKDPVQSWWWCCCYAQTKRK